MAITSIGGNLASSSGVARTGAPKSVDAVAQVFARADKRIQQQRDSTSVKLSSFGRLQAAFADTQTTARALGDSKQTGTTEGLGKAAANFVKAFNKTTTVAREVATASSALGDNSRARIAGNDLRRAVTADAAMTSQLRDIGITQQKDGTLAIDQKKFDAAVQADGSSVRETLARAGQQVDRSATQQLSARGNVGGSINTLTAQARELDTRQTEQQAQAAAVQQIVAAQTSRINTSQVAAGIASYERIFSF